MVVGHEWRCITMEDPGTFSHIELNNTSEITVKNKINLSILTLSSLTPLKWNF